MAATMTAPAIAPEVNAMDFFSRICQTVQRTLKIQSQPHRNHPFPRQLRIRVQRIEMIIRARDIEQANGKIAESAGKPIAREEIGLNEVIAGPLGSIPGIMLP